MTITLTNRRNSAETRVEADDMGEIDGGQLAAADRAVCRCEGRCRCFGVHSTGASGRGRPPDASASNRGGTRTMTDHQADPDDWTLAGNRGEDGFMGTDEEAD
ncbi:MAG: hypothetical protein U0835_10330 [Isosphaeraceae bacterium]